MKDVGWTIESIGYNKDKNAYLAKVSTGTAGAALAANALTSRNQKNKSDNVQAIVFLYLISGFIIGTWGYIKQSIIWVSAANQNKVSLNSAIAHVIIPPIALAFPAFSSWLVYKLGWFSTGINISTAGIIFGALALLSCVFFISYYTLAKVNEQAKVDDFIGAGSALFQSISCLIAYFALAMLLFYPSSSTPNITNQNVSKQVKKVPEVNSTTQKVQNSAFDTLSSNPQIQNDLQKAKSTGHTAFVYKPPSNVRNEPNGDILCSIDEQVNITVYDYAGSTYNGNREVKWYYTDACGSMGVIAYSQFR